MIRSNFRRLFDQGDKLQVVTEDRPGQERTTNLTSAGLQELVTEACRRGFHPGLTTWAAGWMTDYYEQSADEDDDVGERWAYMSPQQRQEFIEQQAEHLATSLSAVLEHWQYEAIPDLEE